MVDRSFGFEYLYYGNLKIDIQEALMKRDTMQGKSMLDKAPL
jgi:hypothetical protein